MKTPTVIKNLRVHRKWASVQSKDTATEKTADHAEDILGGVLDLLDYLPPDLFNLDAWLDRRIRGREAPRKHLDRIRVNFYRGQGKKAFVGLLDVAIEVLSAAAPFIDDVNVGSLPVKVRVPDSGGIGSQKIVAVATHGAVADAAESLGIGDHRIVKNNTDFGQDDQSYQGRVFNTFEGVFNRVSDAEFGQVSVLDQTKICSKCGAERSRTDFYAHPRTSDGLQSQCKGCQKIATCRRRNGASL